MERGPLSLPGIRLRPAPDACPTAPWLWVALGLFAAMVIVVVPMADADGFLEVPPSYFTLLGTVPAHVLLLLAWWQLGPKWKWPLLTAAIWSVPMMFALPLHSRDAYAYAAAGWLANQGADPYLTPLGEAGEPGLLVGIHWFETTSVYPGLSLDVFGLLSRLADAHPYWTTVALRLPSVLALVILAFVLPRLARHVGIDPRLALWAGLLNPIMLVQWIGGVHNDALMVALGAAALLAVYDMGWKGWRGLVVAGILLGLGMGMKQSAALYGLGVVAVAWSLRGSVRPGWWRLVAVAVVPGVITVATFVLSTLSRGFGWSASTAGSPIEATSNAPLSWLAAWIRYREIVPDDVANGSVSLLSTMVVAVTVVLAWVKFGPKGHHLGRPWVFAVLVPALFCLLAPALQPWYLTWLLPLYPFVRVGARWHRWWLIAVAAFSVLPALQDVLPPYLSMIIVGVPLLFLHRRMALQDISPLPLPEPVRYAPRT